jgi:ABC-2 type transport system permease protein
VERNLAENNLSPLVLDTHTTDLPFVPPPRSLATTAKQYAILCRVLLAEYRRTWFTHIFFGMLLPLGLIFFFKMTGGEIDAQRAVFLLGGNMAISITYGPTTMLIAKIGWGRHNREFDYWATLPLPKLILLLAIISVYLLFAIPGLVSSYLVGSWVFGLPLPNGLMLIALAPLCALSLTGFGALLGTYAKDGPTASVYGNILLGFVTFLAPTMIPLETLPFPLRVLAMCVPTTYVADAFRAVLGGRVEIGWVYDLLFITIFSVAFLTLVHWKLDWRHER